MEVEGRLLFGHPKTRAGRRRIGFLAAWSTNWRCAYERRAARPDPVFRSPAGGPLRVTAFRNRIWRPATLTAGLLGLRIHGLRHTAVALWTAAGASLKEVAVRAGHTSTSFVLNRYGHLFPESDAALHNRLDELFVPVTEQRQNTTASGRDQGAGTGWPHAPSAGAMLGWR